MKEPAMSLRGVYYPYSEAPTWALAENAAGLLGNPTPEHPEDYDPGFRRMYAALLLRERGA